MRAPGRHPGSVVLWYPVTATVRRFVACVNAQRTGSKRRGSSRVTVGAGFSPRGGPRRVGGTTDGQPRKGVMGTDLLDSPIVVVARLFIRPGKEAEFRQFETDAARIMRSYGGRIDRVIRPIVPATEGPLPHEIHIVSFPSLERFDAYRGDRDLAGLAHLRQSAISRADVTIGVEGAPYA